MLWLSRRVLHLLASVVRTGTQWSQVQRSYVGSIRDTRDVDRDVGGAAHVLYVLAPMYARAFRPSSACQDDRLWRGSQRHGCVGRVAWQRGGEGR